VRADAGRCEGVRADAERCEGCELTRDGAKGCERPAWVGLFAVARSTKVDARV